MTLALDDRDQAMLAGELGPALQLSARIVTQVAEAMGAGSLLDIESAHIDGCLFHGPIGLEFVQRLVDGGGSVVVPTTLNVASLDLLHPDLYRGDPGVAVDARRQMVAYEQLGCRPTWTCAPYHRDQRPGLGTHVAWAESNAIVFANSVLGARTHRYGDFIDICAALTGRAPAAGLHLDEHRRAEVVISLSGVPNALLDRDDLYPVLGHLVGRIVGTAVPVIDGLPADTSEDRLKALGAAAASSGTVGMFHAAGVTPEAPDLATALGGRLAPRTVTVDLAALRAARDELSTAPDAGIDVVSLGTPHYSIDEFGRLVELLAGRRISPNVAMYVSTGRSTVNELSLRGWQSILEDAGVQLVTDTCTYITPIMAETVGVAMTDSAKWAYYAPGNVGVDVVFGSVEECVESAIAGRVVRNAAVWGIE